jgi:ABC-type amino acid transport substrate-binding protein
MRLHHFLMVIVVAVASVILTLHFVVPKQKEAVAEAKETAYERVMRTGTLRCGYIVWSPAVIKDVNTGEMSGVIYDIMNEIGKRAGLKVEWNYEVNLATYLEDLNAGKYDVECAGGWPNPQRAKVADYSTPLFYLPSYIYAREGDVRFDNNLAAINSADIKFSSMLGEMGESIRDLWFPKSQNVSVPASSPFSDTVLQVVQGKADVTFTDAASADGFMKANPGKIRQVVSAPVKVVPNNFSVAKGEGELREFLSTASEDLLNDGFVEMTLQKYNLTPALALRAAKPYEVAK